MFEFTYDKLERLSKWSVRKRYSLVSLLSHYRLPALVKAVDSQLLRSYLLEHFSSEPLLKCGDFVYPVVIYPNPGGPIELQPDNEPFLDLDLKWQPTILTGNRTFYWLMRSTIGSEENLTFVMKSLSVEPAMKMTCGVSGFFEVLRSSHSLEWELLRSIVKLDKRSAATPEDLRRLLRLRGRLDNRVSNPLLHGDGRAAGIGFSTLLTFNDSGKRKMLLRRRGARSIAVNRGKWHVLPSGMFQAFFGDYDTEFSVLHTALWEYYEELFGREDPETRRLSSKWFYSEPVVRELLDMLSSGDARVWFTGVAINLCNLRPEIMLILDIRDPEWYQRHSTGKSGAQPFKHNDEFATASELASGQRNLLLIEPRNELETLVDEYDLHPSQITPSGAACLAQAVKAMPRLLD